VNQFSGPRVATTSPLRWLRSLATLLGLGLGLLICSEDADARLKGPLGFASNADAAMAFSNVVAHVVADDSFMRLPNAAQPTYPGGSLGGLFNRPGLIGGFAAGFLGSGLLGLLFGRGVVGELSGMASLLGLVFQLILIVMLARLIWTWWRADKAAGFAGLSPRQLADAYGRSRHEVLPDIESCASADAGPGEPNGDAFKQRDDARR